MRRVLALASVIACSSLACGGPAKVSLEQGTREYVASDYPQVLARWTRDGQLYNEFDSPLTVTATFNSWDFSWAYVIRYAYDYRLTVDQRRVLLETTLNTTRDEHQFYIALYGANRRWTDLSRPNSAWIVRLIDDQGGETAPVKIEAIVKPGALERTYFPYTSVYRLAFRIHFPVENDGKKTITPGAKWFGLRFAGAEGNQELHWDVESAADRRAAFGPNGVRVGEIDAAQIEAPQSFVSND
ncbi:MAG: hypothetical protein ABI183_21575 [Polyangiaceae bacterium]